MNQGLMEFNSQNNAELLEVQKRVKVLKAKIKSKQKAIVRATMKVHKETSERATISRAHTLIG